MNRLLTFLFLLAPLTFFAQLKSLEKEMYGFHNGKTLPQALKDPLNATRVGVYEYSDSVFPNAQILQLKNVNDLYVSARLCRRKSSDSLLPPLVPRIDTVALKQLTQLRYLHFVNFGFRVFPEELCSLEHLKGLSISLSFIDSIPPSIARMKSLGLLELRLNKLSSLPASMAQMDSLLGLDLCNNNFSEIPPVVLHMKNLQMLSLANIEGTHPTALVNWSWPYPYSVNHIIYPSEQETLLACLGSPALKKLYVHVYTKEEKQNLSTMLPPEQRKKIYWQVAS